MNLLHKLWPLLFPSWLMHFSCHMPIVEGLFFPWCVHVILINIKATYKYSFGKDRTQSASKCLWQGCPDCQVLQATIQHVHLAESLSLPSDSLSHPASPIAPTQMSLQTLTQSPSASLNPAQHLESFTASSKTLHLQTAWATTPGGCWPTISAVCPCWSLLGPAAALTLSRQYQQQQAQAAAASPAPAMPHAVPSECHMAKVCSAICSLHIMELPKLETDKHMWIIPPAPSRPPWTKWPSYLPHTPPVL